MIQAAIRRSSAARFGPAMYVDGFPSDSGDPGRGSVRLTLDDVGRAVLAWTGGDPFRPEVRVAFTDFSGRFDRPRSISDFSAGSRLTDLASAPSGERLAVWEVGETGHQQVRAALAPPGAAFGLPEVVTDTDGKLEGRAAFDPITGVPTVTWIDAPNGYDPMAVRLRAAQVPLR